MNIQITLASPSQITSLSVLRASLQIPVLVLVFLYLGLSAANGQTSLTGRSSAYASLPGFSLPSDKMLSVVKPNGGAIITVTPAVAPTALDNDYTRINNVLQAIAATQTIRLVGTFDWTEPNAAASWALGSNGIGGDGDDYALTVPPNIDNVSFTADTLGDATIQGPGDLPAVDLEGVLVFNGGDNLGWTISNIRFLDFDLSIAMFSGASPAPFSNTHITNNYIRMARDVAGPSDPTQNIGIYYSFGTNEVISGNAIDIQGDGLTVGAIFASDIGLQCDAAFTIYYDGLQITNNTIRVLNAQSANPQKITGIFENGHAHSSNITISGNSFTNLAAGNDPTSNLQKGIRLTSHSSASTTVLYQNNTISGANVGIEWSVGQDFSANQAVVLRSNAITGNATGVVVQSQGLANLSLNRITSNSVAGVNNIVGTVTAENNWWGCNAGPGSAGCDAVTGTADFDPWLELGVSATPNPINAGGTSDLTADLTHNSDLADTSGLGSVPPTPVSFTATEGTMAPPAGTTAAGQAASVFTSTTSSSGTACATVDSQLVCTPLGVVTSVAVSLPHVTGPTMTLITVPLTVDDLTGKGIKSYDFQVTFDPLTIQPDMVPYDTAGTISSGMTINFNAGDPGHLIISGSQVTDLVGAGTLIFLKFQIVGAPGAATALTFENYSPPPLSHIPFVPAFQFNSGVPDAVTTNGSIHANGPTAAAASLSGRIISDQGLPVSGAVITVAGAQSRKTITDAEGYYRIDNVPSGGFYVVTPSRANFVFSPGQRGFSLVGNKADAEFSGISTGDGANPLTTAEYFVRQQYLDILGREPDEAGFNYWSDQINLCGSSQSVSSQAECTRAKRLGVAAAFFMAEEFQASGSFIHDLYRGALGRQPRFVEYAADRQQVVGGANLLAEKAAFAREFVTRVEFLNRYAGSTTAESFVAALLANLAQTSGVDLAVKQQSLIARYQQGATESESRALVLSALADNAAFRQAEFHADFVLTEYFAYLRRDPDSAGYEFWVNVLNIGDPDNYLGMVCSFVTSAEYQQRFSMIVTHSNMECGQ